MNQLKAGAALNYVVIILNMLVGLLYTPYMLRMMGQSEYGLYSLVASVIAYLTVLDLGLGNAVIRYTAKFRAEGKTTEQYEMFGMFLILYFIIGCIAFVVGMGLYCNVDNMFGKTMTPIELDHARIMMLILVFNLAVTFPMSIFGSIINAYEHFVFPKILNIIRTILNTAIMIVMLHFGYKAIAMVILQTIFNLSTLLLTYVYCKKNLKIKIVIGKFKWGSLKEVAIYSFWIFLNVIMDKIYWSTGQFVLGAVSGTIAISVFAVAIQLQSMYMQFSTAMSSVFLPKVTGMVTANNDSKSLSTLFIRTGRIQNIIMAFILFAFISFGRPFINLWAGNEYSDAYAVTLIFFVSLYIPLIQNLGITILQARNQMKFRSILYIIIACASLYLQYLFAIKWGGIGCAIAIAAALFVGQGIIMNIYYSREQKLDIVGFWREIIKMDFVPIFITILYICITLNSEVSSWGMLFIHAFVYSSIYAILFYKFSLKESEKQLLLDPIKGLFRR